MLAQTQATTTTSPPNPAEGLVEDLSNLGEACGRDPSWVCERVHDWTGNQTLAGLANWFVAKPFAILAVVVGAVVVTRLARSVIHRGMRRWTDPSAARRWNWLASRTPTVLQRPEDWSVRAEARVQALIAVFSSLAGIVVWTVAVLWIFDILAVNVAAFVASVGILGAALAFGAQNVLRDFLAGFFIVVEDQMGVGDVVDLGPDAKGTVERITLRATRVRDVHGTVWHVPNGQLTRVGNRSQEWARAVVDVEVDLDCDYDTAHRVVTEVAAGLAADPVYAEDLRDPPEVWGIDSFTADGYVLRLVVGTRPAAQWRVMRELRVRLHAAFPAAGLRFAGARPELWVHEVGADTSDGTGGDTGGSVGGDPDGNAGPRAGGTPA